MTTETNDHVSQASSEEPPFPEMLRIPGGSFFLGSNKHYPEEGPAQSVTVDDFWMDAHTVTNDEFARFVAATNYVTVAERPLNPDDYPGADPTLLVPGAMVFQRQTGPVDLRDVSNWWAYVPGTSWRHPQGPGSTLDGLGQHPVV